MYCEKQRVRMNDWQERLALTGVRKKRKGTREPQRGYFIYPTCVDKQATSLTRRQM